MNASRDDAKTIATQNLDLKGSVTMSESLIAESPKISSKKVALVMKWLNLIVSLVLLLYVFVYFRGPSYQALQFIQISFISILLIILDASIDRVAFRLSMVVFIICVNFLWLYCLSTLWADSFNLSVAFQVVVYFTGITWGLGITYACYISGRANKETEFDLLLYLSALNAVCSFSPATKMDNTLHLLLDLRTFVLVYTYLHNVPKKEELLQYPTFIAVVVVTIITFLLTGMMIAHTIPQTDGWAMLIFFLFFCIGLLLFWESAHRDISAAPRPTEAIVKLKGQGKGWGHSKERPGEML